MRAYLGARPSAYGVEAKVYLTIAAAAPAEARRRQYFIGRGQIEDQLGDADIIIKIVVDVRAAIGAVY